MVLQHTMKRWEWTCTVVKKGMLEWSFDESDVPNYYMKTYVHISTNILILLLPHSRVLLWVLQNACSYQLPFLGVLQDALYEELQQGRPMNRGYHSLCCLNWFTCNKRGSLSNTDVVKLRVCPIIKIACPEHLLPRAIRECSCWFTTREMRTCPCLQFPATFAQS